MRNLIISLLILLFTANISYAEKNKKDCSAISNATVINWYDKIRCKMGKEERQKGKFGEKVKSLLKNPFKKKN
tara:strand:- start:362 stop:580 length:219 start_codon:yes stop_codon:yes gene_type:complete